MKHKLAIFAFVVLTLACLAWLAGDRVSVEQLANHERQLRQAIVDHPFSSLAIGLGLYYVVSLFPGTSGKSIAMGWLFGIWQGVLIVVIALTAAALTAFALSRYAFRDYVQSRLGHFLYRLNAAMEREGAFCLLTLRMLHVPYTLVNYGAGASTVRTFTFAWTTAVGLLPGTIVFVFLGTQLPTLTQLADNGAEQLLSPWLWVALLSMGLLPLLTRWFIRRIRRAFVPTSTNTASSH